MSLRVLEPEDLAPHRPIRSDTVDRLVEARVLEDGTREALQHLIDALPLTMTVPVDGLALPGRTFEGERGAGMVQLALVSEAVDGTLDGERGIGHAIHVSDAPEEAPNAPSEGLTLDGGRSAGEEVQLRGGGAACGTLDGERGLAEGVVFAADEPLPDSPVEPLVALDVLEAEDRGTILQAAFCRQAIVAGAIDWDQARAAFASDQPTDAFLMAGGLIDPMAAMEINGKLLEPRTVHHETLLVTQTFAGETSSAGGTIVGKSGGGQTITGFPGVGGEFAGHKIIERVAEGAMGVVFRAEQVKLSREVALKVMRGGALASEGRKRRFLLEAEAAAMLNHPAVVSIHEIGEVNGYPFYTMDLLDGAELDKHVKAAKSAPREIAELVRAVAEGVQHFHQHGIIHRDLKPSNVLISGDEGKPQIIDFGIAKRVGGEQKGTIEGSLVGTPEYMAPEQAAGRIREIDTRTDVYALGVIAYELLTGSVPWKGSHAEVVRAIQEKDPPSIRSRNPEVDSDLRAIVDMAMAKERERRYQSAGDLADDLGRYLDTLPIKARPATLGYRLRKAVRRRLPAVIAGAVCLFVVAAAGGVLLMRRAEQRQRVNALLASANDTQLTLAERDELLTRVLELDPRNQSAEAKRRLLRDRQEADARLKEEEAALREEQQALKAREAQQRADQARAELAETRARAEADRLKAQERVRLEAAARAAQEAGRRAGALLQTSKKTVDSMVAIGLVNDALALLPPGKGELRRAAEERKLDLAFDLAEAALLKGQAGLARFWLRGLLSLEPDGAQLARLRDLEDRIATLSSGVRFLTRARELADAGELLAARAQLLEARAQGANRQKVSAEQKLVEARCTEHANEVVGEGQAALARAEHELALAGARRALELRPGLEAALALGAESERRLAWAAELNATRASLMPSGGAEAINTLDQAIGLLSQPELIARLQRSREARRRLLTNSTLNDALVYVPFLPDRELGGFYSGKTEVTNAEFKRFVDAGGYAKAALWDAGDEPSEARSMGAPRAWTDGSFGEASNASRPVRGVTIYEARAYARWLSGAVGATWRLPTEREWELVAGWDPHADRLRRFPWGAELGSWPTTGQQQPGEVGSSPRDVSALGAFDLAGSVLEWVEGTQPGTKGAPWSARAQLAERYAQIGVTGSPGTLPPTELIRWVGIRLVREVE